MKKEKSTWRNRRDELFDFITHCRLTTGDTWLTIEKECKEKFMLTCDFSNVRKEWAIWQEARLQQIDADVELKKIAQARNALMINRKVNVIQRNMLNKQTSHEAFRKLITDTIESSLNEELKPIINKRIAKNEVNETPIYVISDEHYRGEQDVSLITNIFSKIYNDCVINKYTQISVCFLGDGIDGLIHASALMSNDGAILPAINYAKLVAKGLNELSDITNVNVYFTNESNHTQTRALSTSRSELAKEDLGLVIDNIIQISTSNNKRINYESGPIVWFDDNDHTFAILHGHQGFTKSRMSTVEWFDANFGINADMIIMGHYHTFKTHSYGINKWFTLAPAAKQFKNTFDEDKGYPIDSRILKIIWNKNEHPKYILIGV